MRFYPLAGFLLLAALSGSQAQDAPPPDPPPVFYLPDGVNTLDPIGSVYTENAALFDGVDVSGLSAPFLLPCPSALNGQADNLYAASWLTPQTAAPEDGLTEEARLLLGSLGEIPADKPRSIALMLERLQNLQDAYTRLDHLDEADAIREKLEEYKARQAGAQTDPGTLAGFRGQVGKTFRFSVKGAATGVVWGSDIYTDDSELKAAAVHSGVLRDGQRGIIKVKLLDGQAHYNGSERNGIASRDYEAWQASYRIEAEKNAVQPPQYELPQSAKDALAKMTAAKTAPDSKSESSKSQIRDGLNSLRTMEADCAAACRLDPALALRDARLHFVGDSLGARPDPGQFQGYRVYKEMSFYFYVRGHATGPISGDGIYADDAPLRAVVVYAGLLRDGQRGLVKVTILPGRDSYDGGERNGVKSQPYGAWDGSYRVEAAPF